MEEILIKVGQLLLSLSILVVLHELGHFLPAKLFGAKVEKFYLFFDYKFSLFKFKRGETEYGIGWIPLGGYVKIAGMVDESMDTEQLKKEPQPWEFRSKPAWQRLIILMGGVTVNVILAMVIHSMVLFGWGEKYLPNESLTGGMWVTDSLAMDMGFRNGDKVLDINGKKIERFAGITGEMIYGGTVNVQHEGGSNEALKIPENFIETLIEKENKMLFLYRMPFIIGKIPEESPNKASGLMVEDAIVAVNGKEYTYFDEYKVVLKEFAGQPIILTVKRDGSPIDIAVNINDKGQIGVMNSMIGLEDLQKLGYYQLSTKEYGFFESIPAGVSKAGDQLSGYLRQLKLIFNPTTGAYKGVGGFAAIGNLFPPVWDWQTFWQLTAFLSIMLAVLNLLPIPALDGGHVMFTLYEMISGRKPNEKFMEYAQMAGIILLLSLFVFANGNDVYKLIFK